jgi:lipopolysaccharide transport system ATP-binding protein
MTTAISARGLGKKYVVYPDRKILAKDIFLLSALWEKGKDFWALRDVGFEIQKGEIVGVIGENGSGKSTLLKILSGVTFPSEGAFEIRGRLTALLELGAGFHHLLTGRENIYLNGLILGMSNREVSAMFDPIVDFAGIGEFIDQPVKNYSSGMFVRLGFAVAIHMSPDIMVVDEVLSVGDVEFQMKCQQKIQEFREKGGTILFVSHDMDLVYKLCSRAIFLHKGRMEALGPAEETIRLYWQKWIEARSRQGRTAFRWTASASPEIRQAARRSGSAEAEIVEFEMRDETGAKTKVFRTGQPVTFALKYKAARAVSGAVFDIRIFRADGTLVTDFSSRRLGRRIDLRPEGGATLRLDYFPFIAGDYQVSAQIANEELTAIYDVLDKFYEFTVLRSGVFMDRGIVELPGVWSLEGAEVEARS